MGRSPPCGPSTAGSVLKVTIWTAIFGIPLLHKSPNKVQWAALVLIVAGLLSSAMSHTAKSDVALVPQTNLTAFR